MNICGVSLGKLSAGNQERLTWVVYFNMAGSSLMVKENSMSNDQYELGTLEDADEFAVTRMAKMAGLDHYLIVRDFTKQLQLFAAIVRAEREWCDLTDDEIAAVMDYGTATAKELEDARAVIAAFKEKQK